MIPLQINVCSVLPECSKHQCGQLSLSVAPLLVELMLAVPSPVETLSVSTAESINPHVRFFPLPSSTLFAAQTLLLSTMLLPFMRQQRTARSYIGSLLILRAVAAVIIASESPSRNGQYSCQVAAATSSSNRDENR